MFCVKMYEPVFVVQYTESIASLILRFDRERLFRLCYMLEEKGINPNRERECLREKLALTSNFLNR